MLAMAASGFLWFCMIALMVFIVMSMALKYINLINNAANGNF
jgi:hypothetical protein